MFAGAVYGENRAAYKLFRLAGARRFEGLRKAAKPNFNDAIAADTLVDAASDRLYLRQFRHRLIVEDCVESSGPQRCVGMKRETLH